MSAAGGEALLAVEGLTKSFGGLVAVQAVDLAVFPREIVGLIGPNGAGKTTLFAVISGFLRPDRGRVRFDSQDITGLRPHQIARRGLVRTFQVVQPFPAISALENVMMGSFARERSPRRARARSTGPPRRRAGRSRTPRPRTATP